MARPVCVLVHPGVSGWRERGRYDRVLVFILPASLLLSGVPSGLVGPHWIFDYQESVTPHLRRHPRTSPLHRATFPLLRKLERHTLHKAGRIIFTSDTNRRAYLQEGLVKESATAQIPYFFDAEIFRAPPAACPQQFQIVYPGNFDWHGARTPETFLRSLARFLERRPEARPRTNFLFHGNWLLQHNRFLEELKLRDVASIQPPVSYEEYIRKLKQSTVLLLVVSAAHSLFMPSKIVDYFGVRRPILAFVPGESEMRRVLESAGFADFACDEFDIAGGASALERLWDRYLAGTLVGDMGKSASWSSEVQIPRYLDFVLQAKEPV
jgi:glycosyltransferase involved in cell wall biosynthesis